MELEHVIPNTEKTFGALKFSALRREVKIVEDEENLTEQVKERTYDLK